jgi:hypothetical protein
MKILIEIHCETKEEVFQHIHAIGRILRAEFRNNGEDDEIENDFELYDANCYGEHEVYGFVDDSVQMAIDESQTKKVK